MLAQSREEPVVRIVDFAPRERHRVGIGQSCTLARIERTVVRDLSDDSVQLLVREPGVAADGSVDVLSEETAVVCGDAAVDERLELDVDQPELAKRAPHAAHPAKERGEAGVDEMIGERRAPLLCLRIEDARDLGRD
jgi:hypothetical protein